MSPVEDVPSIGDDENSSSTSSSSRRNSQQGKSGQAKVNNSRKRKRASEAEGAASLNGSAGGVAGEEYEVERIVEHQEEAGMVTFYLVKWKGWPDYTNTWEPLDNLRGALDLVVEYFERGLDRVEYGSQIKVFKERLYTVTEADLNKMCETYLRSTGDKIPQIDVEEHENLVCAMAKLPRQARCVKMMKELKQACQILEFKRMREFQLKSLLEWEEEMNRVSVESARISVVNCVDLEKRPVDFKYINKYRPVKGVTIPEDPPVGCDCAEGCVRGGGCLCEDMANQKIVYTGGLLSAPKGTPIYECNKKCRCPPECGNRVLQKGRTVKLSIFKTNNGCGWGVRTLEKIRKGQFVTEYVGEVITNEEAERRGKRSQSEGRTYLFDLDFNDRRNCPYTVDAAEYGNVSHFINHSCSPNLEVFAVWVDCLDPDIPRLGLYASRNIRSFEEITFDYFCQSILKNGKKADRSGDGRSVLCKCTSSKCRGFMF